MKRGIQLGKSFESHLIEWEGLFLKPQEVLNRLHPYISPSRKQKMDEVLSERSLHFPVVLEELHNEGNISAVLRSAEAFGFQAVHIIEHEGGTKFSPRTTQGADNWLSIRRWSSADPAISQLKKMGYQIAVTDLEAGEDLFTMDWSRPTALVLGNELRGVSEELKNIADRRFRIPMVGFSQSFNISVAAALIFSFVFQNRKMPKNSSLGLDEKETEYLKALFYLQSVRSAGSYFRVPSKIDKAVVHPLS